jgi:hypothetical protein
LSVTARIDNLPQQDMVGTIGEVLNIPGTVPFCVLIMSAINCEAEARAVYNVISDNTFVR